MAVHKLTTRRASMMADPIVLAVHDPVPRNFRRGGLARSADRVRRAGRYGDTVLVHLHPEELDELRAYWGEPTINPRTGLPEYFIKRLAKKAKKFVKRLAKNPLVGALAPMAMSIFLPGVGGLIGQSLFGALRAHETGGNPLLGAALGAGGHFLGGGNAKMPGAQPGAGAAAAGIAPGEGGVLGRLPADGVGPPDPISAASSKPGVLGRIKDFYTTDAGNPAWGKIAGTAGGVLGALGAMSAKDQAGGPPPDDPRFTQSLPNLSFDRSRLPVSDYYRYGESGVGERSFFDQNRLPSMPQDTTTAAPTYDPANITPEEMLRHVRRYSDGGGVRGPGSGRSDDIEANLSDGEYVIDAESVALLGDGSTDEGARRLDEMRKNLRRHKGQALSKGKFTPAAKPPEGYMPKVGKARGGEVKAAIEPLLKLAGEFEAEMRGGNSRRAAQLAAQMDVMLPGASRRARAEFSRGGSVAAAVRKFFERRSRPERRAAPRGELPRRRESSPEMLREMVNLLAALDPESETVRKYRAEPLDLQSMREGHGLTHPGRDQ